MKKKAFTLVELLTIITLIGLLVIVVVMLTAKLRRNGLNASAQNSVSQGGKAIELFKANNDDRIPIVQRTVHSVTGNLMSCFLWYNGHCYPGNSIVRQQLFNSVMEPTYHTGLPILFKGIDNSSNFFPANIDKAPNQFYSIHYMTVDCSTDALGPNGEHKLSRFSDYLLITGLSPDPLLPMSSFFWMRSGAPGSGEAADIPYLPPWPGHFHTESIDGVPTVVHECLSGYP